MRYHYIGTTPRDADTARRDAKRDGERDGSKNFPPVDPSGETTATDYFGRGLVDEATATDTLTKAGHFGTQRVEDDTTLGKARASTAEKTAHSTDARQGNEDALAEERAYKQRFPLSAKFGFWNHWIVWGLLALLAGASGAAVTNVLGSVTTDSNGLSYIIGIGVALAAVGGGASLGFLLRRRDLDTIKRGNYSSHGIYSGIVIVIVVLGLIAIAVGVAGLRDAASKADAARRADQSQIQVFIPGQQQQPQTPGKIDQPESRGVNWPIWLAFEFGLAAAALSLEFQRADARAEHGDALAREVTTTHSKWTTALASLKDAVAIHEVALLTCEDHDFAVILTGNGQQSFNARLASDYRHANLSQRGQGGDPFETLTPPSISELEETFNINPGVDVVTLSTHDIVEEASGAPFLEKLRDDKLLNDAYAELGKAPQRPQRADTEAWAPGEYLATDASAQALRQQLLDDAAASVANPKPSESAGREPTFWDEFPEETIPAASGNGSES